MPVEEFRAEGPERPMLFPLLRNRWPSSTYKSLYYNGSFVRRNSTKALNLSGGASVKPYYITTPIFYPNAVPHIGHLYTLVLGDIFARYQRRIQPDRPVKFLVGTDEHGMKIQQAAAKAALLEGPNTEVDVLGFCDRLSEVFQNLSKKANISYTVFARTTQERHERAVEHVWRSLYEKGYIYKGEYEGWYSITDECFYTSAQVTQMPGSPTDTSKEPIYISKETGSVVEWSREYNYMFRLSAFREALLQHYSEPRPQVPGNTSDTIVFPSQYNSVVLQMLSAPSNTSEGDQPLLADISISRPRSRLTWGIPVPNDADHTVYVWFDALLIYLSGVGYPWSTSQGKALTNLGSEVGWPADLQIIGKDILRFHSLYLPAIILALSAPKYTEFDSSKGSELLSKLSIPLPRRLLTHAHWTVSQMKMSKSIGNVVDPIQSLDTYGVDIVRFYLARIGGKFRDDVDWSFEQLEKHSKELQSLLGNYLLRITSPRITAAAAQGRDELQGNTSSVPVSNPLNDELARETAALPRKVKENLDNLEVADAISAILDLLRLANKVITDIAPWSKTCPPSLVYETRQTALQALRVAGICLEPFIPETAEKLLNSLGLTAEERTWESVLNLGTEGDQDRWKERDVTGVRLF